MLRWAREDFRIRKLYLPAMRSSRLSATVLTTLFLTVLSFSQTAAEQPPFGLDKRTPWTTSNFRGRPEAPPPYRPESIYPQLRFEKTTVLAFEPSTSTFFVAELGGKIFVLPQDRNATKAELFLDVATLVDRLNPPNMPPLALEALYGLTFDPKFATNRFCYVCYVVRSQERNAAQLPDGTRVVRFRVTDTDPPRCEIDSETLVISWLQGGHNGGCLKFGPDGFLYISTGDGGVAFPPDGLNSGQDMTTLLAKVLRIDVHRGEHGQAYAIPPDNPFVKLDQARGEIWSYGMRNPWKMSFDRETGELWVGDVGWELWELIYRVHKGDNYGWSIVEGSQPVHTERQRGPTPIVQPIMEIPHTEGASITGGFVYRGRKFPELVGHYIFGDWETRRIWGAKIDGEKLGERRELIDSTVRIVDFAEDNEGELYLLDHENGAISTLVSNPQNGEPSLFPRKLSETGLFQSVTQHAPAPGVLPFAINAEQWSDHATAERWIGVPGSESIRLHAKAQPIPNSQFSRATDYPLDTVLLKTLSLELDTGNASSRRRIETQALHYNGRDWLGYTYEWNDEQTDAVLVDRNGKSRTFHVADPSAPGGQRVQTWKFSSRNECLRCHNPWSEYTLAFNVAQLNRTHDFGETCDNQLRTLKHIGLLDDVIDDRDQQHPLARQEWPLTPEQLPKLTPPFDAVGDINLRARSYLHVNCSHCHRYNGGGSSYIYLQHDLSLLDTKAVGVRPTQGTFAIHDPELLAPGDPYRSVLYFRLAKTGPGHMPHLGASTIDERGLKLVHDWIRQLPVRIDDIDRIKRLIENDEPLALARELDELPLKEWKQALTQAKQDKRDSPGDADFAAARMLLAEQAAAALTRRATDRQQLIDELLTTPARAMQLAASLREESLPPTGRSLVLESALRPTTDPAIRDLFEAFIPESQRTRRLGDSINSADILQLDSDLARGRKLFHESTVVQCRSCHRIDGKGTELVPDLDAIGKKYDRPKLLESILQPSLQIDPKFTMYLVETISGTVHSGLLVERNNTGIVVRDVQNKTRRVETADIEGVYPQTKSLMPDVLLRDLTAQQVADLLAYLSSLKADVTKATAP